MAKLLYRLGRWSYHYKWIVVALWALVLILFGTAAGTLQKGFSDSVSIPGTASQSAVETLLREFPDARNPLYSTGVTYAFKAPEGHTLAEYSSDIDKVLDYVKANVPNITDTERFGNPVTYNEEFLNSVIKQETDLGIPEDMAKTDAHNLSMLSDDGRIGFFTFSIDVPTASELTNADRQRFYDGMKVIQDSDLQVEMLGQATDDPIEIETSSEVIGLVVAFLVLLFTFGSMIAAGLPLITAVIGVAIGLTSILIGTHFVDLNNITPVLSIMIGLAVGIDYALFILSRYRAEYQHTTREEAAGLAVGTAGSAVVFAGLTVVIALAALVTAGIPFLTYMGLAAAFTVATAVAVALTLVPALLGVFGRYTFGVNIFRWRKPKPGLSTLSERWIRLVHRHPGMVFAIVVFILGALTLPTTELQLALPSDKTSSESMTQRRAADILEEGFGPGINAPFLVVVDAHNVKEDSPVLQTFIDAQVDSTATAEQRTQAARTASFLYTVGVFNSLSDVQHAQLLSVNEDLSAAQIYLTPNAGPQEAVTAQILQGLRVLESQVEDVTGITIGITGLTPIQQDVTSKLENAMPLYLAIIVGLAIVLLLMVFRSLMVPIVAALGFLLSVGAAFGTTVLFWQKGLWGLVDAPGPLISFMPIFLIGVTFGLAMDYQVFLVSRMRERYVSYTQHQPGKRIPVGKNEYNLVEKSIIEGFSLGSRVVAGAAIIMISVFAAFINQSIAFIQIFGFALGAGVLFDAFFVRMTLVPATLFLLGRSTWWIPKWLDKILPHVDVEGEGLVAVVKQKRKDRDQAQEEALARLRAKH
ncbi:MAG: MMPL family transporter [Corynebacterium sp.]|nr:MMPL family transporter [Corynebacterium sp.]